MEQLLNSDEILNSFTLANQIVTAVIAIIVGATGFYFGRASLGIQRVQAQEQIRLIRLDKRIKEKELEINSVRDNLKGANSDLDRRLNELKHIEERYISQHDEIFQIKNEIMDLENDIEKSKARIEQLEKKLNNSEEKFSEYREERKNLANLIVRTRSAIGHIRGKLEKMQVE